MAPQEPANAQNHSSGETRPLIGDEVVISGMSGIFPSSDNVLQFMENLYNKVDMVTSEDPRWVFNHPEVPKHLGKVNGMGKFDAQFFRVHYKQACTMEPMSRKLLEHAYSAIYDSGVNPLQLRGRKVGVFIGSTFSESEKIVIYENVQRNGFGITGCNKAMYANRISYWIDGKGPSYALDLACASSMACLEHAYRSISTGQCDAAIVGGCNLCMHPNVSLNLRRGGFLCLDGKTKCFDKNADGYVRSDAISVLFLQKAKDAKRIYSEVYYAKGSYSLRPDAEFLPIRQSKDIKDFLEAFYSDIDVSPEDIEYVEACGPAIAEADGNELEAIGQVFAKQKTIRVGSVKSNMGHSEPASGVCALTKVCLAYHKGKLPANLHYYEPQDHISSIRDGKVQVLQEHQPFNRGYTALNSFSYSGANIHVLLKGRYKPKDLERYKSSIPHIVLVSGRKESCVNKILDLLKNSPLDPEQLALLHNIHESDIPGHMCRGYTILDTNEKKETVSLSQNVEYCPGYTRPLWFVYSGMGSQWAGMGTELMRIPTFAAAIERCRKVLEPRGVDVVKILTDPDKTIYDNILNSFVGIAAVQIGLTDILREIGIVPDNIIGHSVGELGCAYADGCFTAEEMILSAYSRGLVSVQTSFIRGSMAAVGLGYKAVLPLCPPQIEVACHNSSESSTISGPVDVMKKFVAELTKRGVFAKEVPCSNIAYHSRYIADAGPGLQQYLSEVITDPKPRSEKWVSTSVPQDKWDDPVAKFSSAEYHTNNLLNPVLFEEASKTIPSNALVIEIAPHGLLQAIIKRSLSECTHIPLTRRGHSNPVKFLLEAIGKLYESGLNPKVDILYPKIEYPVATETPLLSHYVEWEHSEDWPQAKYNTKDRVTTAIREFVMSIHDDDYKYFNGHIRDGACVVPEAALLVLIWETLAMQMGVDYRELSVTFHDVQFHSEVNIKAEVPLKLGIMIHKGNRKFEVNIGDTEIASGYINDVKSSDIEFRYLDELQTNDEEKILTAEDIYTMMHLRGYSYNGPFQSIHSSNTERNKAVIKWKNEWVTFLDSLIQFNAFAKNHNGISVPRLIKKISINIKEHEKTKKNEADDFIMYEAKLYDVLEITRCGGVELDGIVYTDKAKPEQMPNTVNTKTFVPHFITGDVDIATMLRINLQILADNILDKAIKITQIIDEPDETNITNIIKEVAKSMVVTNINVNILNTSKEKLDIVIKKDQLLNDPDMFIVYNLLGDEKKMKKFYNTLPKNGFILALERDTTKIYPKYKLFEMVTAMTTQRLTFIMLKRANLERDEDITYIPIAHDKKFSWIPRLRSELLKPTRIVLISERQPYDGLLGLVKSLRKNHGYNIGLVIIDDYHAPSFDPEHGYFKEQMQKNLSINILRKNQWGGYYCLPSAKSINLCNVMLSNTEAGIDNVTWIEAPHLRDGNNLVKVYYAALSFKDTEKAVRNIKESDTSFGMDFSGIDSKGERVIGLVPGGAIASMVKADQHLLWPVPQHWTLEDAATVPLPYVLAYYSLAIRSELRRGSIVFVNGGAGALGQAVISICLSIECTVYAAVSDIKKKRFLLRLFPQLNENNIGNSRDITFQDMVIHNSKNKRCDVVVNCVSGELREAAMECVGFSGIFLDVSNYDSLENKEFGMHYLAEIKNYMNVQLSSLFQPEYMHEKKAIQFMISDGIARGVVRPISSVIYSPEHVSRAFRLLSSSRHRGRVLIRMKNPLSLDHINIKPRMSYSSKGTYVIVCGENELGIELVDRIVRQGARNITIHLRQNLVTGYFFTKYSTWKKLGATVKLVSDDLKTERACMNLINEGKKLGPIYGIFIIQDIELRVNEEILEQKELIEKFNNMPLIIANLDLISRKTCPELSHFVVLGCSSTNASDEYAFSTSEKICETRNDVGLPALVLRIESLTLFDKSEEEIFQSKAQPQTVSAVFNALETSLKLKYNNVVSFDVNERTNSDFLRKISNVLGLEDINSVDENLTLDKLSVNEINVEEIKSIIKEAYQMDYPNEKIQKMSLLSLKELEACINIQRTRFDSGFGAFYTFIDEDECMATEPMVSMPTKLSNATEKEEELDPKATYLMLIPGFEGHHHIFTQVCERLKVQAMTFQLSPDLTNDSIQQMAVNIMTFMKKRFELKSKFYLIGYSFGVNVALELAALMETDGHVGIVHCLDSSPDALRAQMDAYLGDLNDTQLQNSIIIHMYSLMTGQHSVELQIDLENTDNWSQKVEVCVNRLRGLVNYSHQYKRSLLQSAYNRIKLARDYEPNFKLESEIVLMKGIPHPKAKILADDYNLSKYTKRPVQVFDLKSDHALAPYDCRVSNIVNRLFDAGVLEEFKKKNLCETYLADPYKIL